MTSRAMPRGGRAAPDDATSAPLLDLVVDDSACDPNDLAQCGGVEITAGGDVRWDDLVERAVTSGWPGFELLGGMAETVAESVRRNVERYGQAVADVVASVRTQDELGDTPRSFAWAECGFVPGGSRFTEGQPDGRPRYEILDVTFLLRQGDLTAPIRSAELAQQMGVEVGSRLPLAEAACLVRRRRGSARHPLDDDTGHVTRQPPSSVES